MVVTFHEPLLVVALDERADLALSMGEVGEAVQPQGLLGLNPQLVADDPVLRELQLANFTAQHDFGRLAMLALRHPPAARVLRQVASEAHLSETALLAT